MRLNTKIALILLGPMLVLTGVFAWAIHVQVLGRFAALEQSQQEQNHDRLLQAIAAELDGLEQLTRDWGVYDETYHFMLGENPEFIEANFTQATFDNLQLDGILLFDSKNHVREQFGFDRASKQFIPLSVGLINRIAASLGERKNPDIYQGILEFEGRVAQLAISPILDSNAEKESVGSLIMLRFVDQGAVDALAKRIKLSLQFMPLRGPGSSAVPPEALAALKDQPLWLHIDNGKTASSFSMLNDLSGEPALLMQVSMPRDIFREGQATVRQLIGFTFFALLIFVSGTFFAIRWVALKRLSRLSKRLIAIGADGGSKERLLVQGNDEITRVARSVNAMLDGLDQAFEQRRRASERQRELNALLVRIATDDSVAHGDAGALFQILGGSLAAGASLDRWSLWLTAENGLGFECLRASSGQSQQGMTAAILTEALTSHRDQPAPFVPWTFDARGTHHGLILPFHLDSRHGALCVEADTPDALNQPDELNFLIAATQLIERSLHTHFQNQREHDLRQRAEIDALTGLANRSMFESGLRRSLEQAHGKDRVVGLLFIDLDRFKPINDTYGHTVGDWLLCQVADRLRERVRTDDIVARLGGDEFTIVLASVRSPQDAERIADKILEALTTPFDHELGQLQTGASIGLAWAPQHGSDVATLVKAADMAMYEAKKRGRGNWVAAGSYPSAQPPHEPA